jgi:hypothetical protein
VATKSKCSDASNYSPETPRVIRGRTDTLNRFNHDEDGPVWLAFSQEYDCVFWQPRTGEIATLENRVFALGQGAIFNAGTWALGNHLTIHGSVLDWLRASRKGIHVFDWQTAFWYLRDCPTVAVDESILPFSPLYPA